MSAEKFLVENPIVGAAIVAGLVFGFYAVGRKVITEAGDAVGGVISGNNPITENQTDADGNPTDAYQGAGVVGTVGAVANSASGGVLATIGQDLGQWAFDLFGPKVDINPHVKRGE